MKKVAIITRTKDRPTFLNRAFESVASQVYKDYVHVVVNDGGDKNIVDSLVAALPVEQREKTKVYHRVISSNAPDTIFNESVDKVDSEYFVIHDDDDTWHKDFLLKTVVCLDSNKDLAAVVVRADKITEELVDARVVRKKTTQWMPDLRAVSLYRQCIDNQLTPIATLIRRDAYKSIGKFDETLPVVGDWEFGVRLLLQYAVDFIDPGYALANYHHRKKIGSSQDAVSNTEMHRYYMNRVMNKYLREELADGRLGVGYIMSSEKYSQGYMVSILSKLLPLSMVNRLKKRVGN